MGIFDENLEINLIKFFSSGGVFTNSDVSVVPLARKADIMIMKNKSRDLNELDDMR